MDKSSFAGVAIAAGGILLGLTLEGGKIAQIMQPTAAMIVIGGTLGAVMLQFPLSVVLQAFRQLGSVFFHKGTDPGTQIGQLVALPTRRGEKGLCRSTAKWRRSRTPS